MSDVIDYRIIGDDLQAVVITLDPHEAGFMPLALRCYKYAEERLQAEGLGIKMVAARGPMVTAGWVMGISDLMMGVVTVSRNLLAKFERMLGKSPGREYGTLPALM